MNTYAYKWLIVWYVNWIPHSDRHPCGG